MSKHSFERAPLKEVAFFQEGPGLRNWQWADDGMKVINVTNILGDGSVDVTNTDKYVSLQEFESRYQHFAVEDGDIVVASSGNTYGKVGRVSTENLPLMMNTSVIRFHSADETRLDNEFLYTFLRSPLFKNQVAQFVTGGAQPNFGPTHLKQMWIVLPSIDEQTRITSIVSPLDDLIENNRRRIQLLEQSARMLYREWFVSLRFPGHEHVRVVDGVPEEWERKSMSDVAETIGGGTPPTSVSAYWENGTVTWFTPTDLTRNDCLALLSSEKRISEEGLKNSSAKMLPPDTILMSSRASIGYFGLHDKPACTNQGFISLIPRDDTYRYYLLHNLMHRKEEIISHAGGTTYKEINKSTFRALPITVPGALLLSEFAGFAHDVMKQTRTLKKEIVKLREARDLLLPRLMSGEIAA